MKKIINIGIIITLIGFLICFLFVIPSILSLFDDGVRNISFSRGYFYDVSKYNSGLGLFGILLWMGAIFIMGTFYLQVTRKIENSVKTRNKFKRP